VIIKRLIQHYALVTVQKFLHHQTTFQHQSFLFTNWCTRELL